MLAPSNQASSGGDSRSVVIEGICQRVDGLPLAIELAAARLGTLPLSTLAERLDDRFSLLTRGARTALPRQQTLRAVVDWSYDLLFDDERRLFRRLSVFVGGCELDAVEAVCADDELPRADALDLISRLVDKSLVAAPTFGEPRFTQLQTLWQYGRDRLTESGEADTIRVRHAAYYRLLAEDANEVLRGPRAPAWRQRLTSELANLKTALDWHVTTGDIDAALSMASGMAWLWFINGDLAEGARWLAGALDVEGERRPDLAASAHVWHGYCVGMSSSPSAGAAECDEAIVALRSGVDRVRLAEALLLGASVLVRRPMDLAAPWKRWAKQRRCSGRSTVGFSALTTCSSPGTWRRSDVSTRPSRPPARASSASRQQERSSWWSTH